MNARRPLAAITGLGLAFAVGCSPSRPEQPSSRDLTAAQLANDPAALHALLKPAENAFEDQVKRGKAEVYLFVSTCALVGEHQATDPAGRETVQIIPNPAAIHTIDSRTKATVIEAVAWDKPERHFLFGLVTVIGSDGSAYDVPQTGNDQFNLTFSDTTVGLANVTLSKADQEVVTTANQILVMDVAGYGLAKSAKDFSSTEVAKAICNDVLVNPPTVSGAVPGLKA
jgi:hypothetical protein